MQVRDYIPARSSHPSDAWVPVQGEGVDTQSLPCEPQLDDGPWMKLTTRDLGDLDDDQLLEVLEAVQLKTARRVGATPHTGHPRAV